MLKANNAPYQNLALFGRIAALGLAELESRLGAAHIHPIGRQAAYFDGQVQSRELGGIVRLAKTLTELSTVNWFEIEKYLLTFLPDMAMQVPEGKLTIGMSVFELNPSPKQLEKTLLTLKKLLRNDGRSVRIVPNKQRELSTPQVIHNHLTGPNGWEIIIYSHAGKTVIAQTTDIQDIESYTKRDQGRPYRDAKVGMLPPKLAQIILNLACPSQGATVLDPFCGTGVLLQEAKLNSFSAYGTDLDQRMVEYTTKNLDWLDDQFRISTDHYIEQGNATTHVWNKQFHAVASEIFLGKPLSTIPSFGLLEGVSREVHLILEAFLNNLARQTSPGFRLCLAVPAWKRNQGFYHLPLLDHLSDLGYNRVSFAHVKNSELMYYRDDQVVARELLVLVRK